MGLGLKERGDRRRPRHKSLAQFACGRNPRRESGRDMRISRPNLIPQGAGFIYRAPGHRRLPASSRRILVQALLLSALTREQKHVCN